MSGWARICVAFLLGAVSALSMAPFDFIWVLFFTVPVFIWVMDSASSEQSEALSAKLWEGFKPGFFFGFGYFLAGLWWIGNALLVDAEQFAWALPVAVVALPALLGVFWGLATSIAHVFWRGEVGRVFLLAGCLSLFEFLRAIAFTGFPWNSLGYAAYFNTVTMQTASVLGIYPMTALVILIAALPLSLFPALLDRSFRHILVSVLCLFLIGAHVGYGFWRLDSVEKGYVEGVSLRLVQPAIAQTEKFDRTKEAELFQRYLDLSVREIDGIKLSDVTHLIWPESAFPFLLTERRDALAAIAAMIPQGTSLITGAARAEPAIEANGQNLVFNSVYVIDDSGEIVSASDKVHLVPFGEYLPFQDLAEQFGLEQLTQVRGGFSAGVSRKLMTTGTGPTFLPLVCYEIIFSASIWDGEERPGFILNLTNDAWFGITPGPYQHLRQAVVRAVEEGLPLVRVANTGISGVFTAYGSRIAELELGAQGVIDASLPAPAGETFFKRHGQSVFWLVLAVFFLVGLRPLAKQNS